MAGSTPIADLRPLLAQHGPESLLAQIGSLCAEAASAEEVSSEAAAHWESAAEAAANAATSLRDDPDDGSEDDEEETDEDADDEDGDPEEEGEDGAMPDESETAPSTAVNAKAEAPVLPATPAPTPRRAEPMKMRDRRIGPWPADTTHWRGRLCDAQGKYPRGGKLLSAYEGGIEVFEFSIKALSIEALCALGKPIGDFWVMVEYYRLDERGRMPRGRSRALHIVTPEAARKEAMERAAPPPVLAPPLPLQAGGGSDATFAHMLSLLAFMQDRDEKARAAAREEARVAHERYVADIELMKERERCATQRQIAEMESKAKIEAQVLGRAARVSATGFDREALRELLREELDDRLGDPEPPADAPPAKPPAQDGVSKLAETVNGLLANQIVPMLLQRFLAAPALPSAPNPGKDWS